MIIIKAQISAFYQVIFFCLVMLLYCQSFGRIQTPLELCGFKKLTGYASMIRFFADLSSQNKRISLRIIGKSVQGSDISALFSWGLVSKNVDKRYRFVKFLKEGAEYPIYRIKSHPRIKLEKYWAEVEPTGENKDGRK